jgi:hypothetical protein
MSLAAFIGLYNADRALYWTIAKNGFPLRGLSAAVAGVSWDRLLLNEGSIWNSLVRPTSIVEFRWLSRIYDEVIHTLEPQSFRDQKDKVEGRIVLLGNTGKECGDDPSKWGDQDCFQVTGVPGPVHGVFLHACAAQTIAANEPIYQLTWLGRIAIDVVLAFVIITAVKLLRWLRSLSRHPREHREWTLNVVFTLVTILFVFIVSVGLVRRTRLLWTDFLFACAVLLVQLIIDTSPDWSKFFVRSKSNSPKT